MQKQKKKTNGERSGPIPCKTTERIKKEKIQIKLINQSLQKERSCNQMNQKVSKVKTQGKSLAEGKKKGQVLFVISLKC